MKHLKCHRNRKHELALQELVTQKTIFKQHERVERLNNICQSLKMVG